MGSLAGTGLLLLVAIGLSQGLGLKCGIRAVDFKSKETVLASGFFSRLVSWRNSTVGRHPWQVSLKYGARHFCGGSLIQDDLVVTAARCLASLHEKQIKSLVVTAGEYNLFQKEEQEQTIPVSKIIIHPEYNSLGYMNSDIALLYLKHKVKFGAVIQPICLPHKEDKFEAGVLCMASGWGKISETSEYSSVLQEVELLILDDRTCNTLLKSMKLPSLERTMLCAGFPDGGKDACQGDSGGPLVCRRDSGTWALVGITSWGDDCAGGWASLRNKHRRTSPGIFSKVSESMDFITQNMVTGGTSEHLSYALNDCRPQGTVLFGESGKICYPCSKKGNYSHNCLCMWKIMAPEDKIILMKFTSLDVENQVTCDHDYISLQSSKGVLISKVCGDILPSPLLTETNEATITFVSDIENSGRGFELTFTAVHKNSETHSGCGSVAILVEEGMIHSAQYPDLYPRNVRCPWLIRAPEKHIIKLAFEDFTVEVSKNCVYDAIVIYGDPEEEHELAKLCGTLTPTPIFSPSNMMVIHFKSDGENNFRGFKARVTFLPSDSLNKIGPTSPPKSNPLSLAKAIPYDLCGVPPFSPQWLSRRIAGGQEACRHCWPWQVGMRFLGAHQCGGAIVSPVWILTAAHCVQSKNNPLYWTVIAGDHDRTLKESTEQVMRVKHIMVHEDFDILSFDSDIALIQLSSPLEYNMAVRPVCLPQNSEPLFSSEICAVTGWGSTGEDGGLARRLQQIQVPVLEREVCGSTYYSAHPGGITERMICAGLTSSGATDFCQGDSGGPLVCRHEKGPFVLYGIVSWGAGCAQARKPGVFARVTVFLDWIQSKIKDAASAPHQINHESKTLTEQLLPPMPPTESASGAGESCEIRSYPMVFVSSGPLVRVEFRFLWQGVVGMSYIVFSDRGPKGTKITRHPQSLNQEPVVTCENVILTKPAGVIEIPRHSHGSSMSCQWRIVALLNHIIRLNIISSQMNSTPLTCQGHLSVYEGFGLNKKLLGCLVLDLIPLGSFEITSPNYPNMLNCTWTSYSTSENKVKAVIKDFIMEESWNCEWDYVNIYDGPDEQSGVLAHLCGFKKEFGLISSGAYLTLHFKTGESVGERDFKLILEELVQKQPQKNSVDTPLPIDEDLFAKTIQQAKVQLINRSSCQSYWEPYIKNTNRCGRVAGSSSCMGDSQGLLQYAQNGQYNLVGIMSWGSNNCHSTTPSVFRISAYRDWITSVTGGEA